MGNKEEQNLDTDKLLKEYEQCRKSVHNIENTIWKTGGLLGLGSLGTSIALIVGKANIPGTILVGLLISIILWIWWGMAKRWWDIQHTTYIRIAHIEKELGLFQTRYIRYRDRNDIDIDIKDEYKEMLRCFFNKCIFRSKNATQSG